MWGKIIIPMYRLWLNGLYGLYGPRCPLFSKRPINLISLSLSVSLLGIEQSDTMSPQALMIRSLWLNLIPCNKVWRWELCTDRLHLLKAIPSPNKIYWTAQSNFHFDFQTIHHASFLTHQAHFLVLSVFLSQFLKSHALLVLYQNYLP